MFYSSSSSSSPSSSSSVMLLRESLRCWKGKNNNNITNNSNNNKYQLIRQQRYKILQYVAINNNNIYHELNILGRLPIIKNVYQIFSTIQNHPLLSSISNHKINNILTCRSIHVPSIYQYPHAYYIQRYNINSTTIPIQVDHFFSNITCTGSTHTRITNEINRRNNSSNSSNNGSSIASSSNNNTNNIAIDLYNATIELEDEIKKIIKENNNMKTSSDEFTVLIPTDVFLVLLRSLSNEQTCSTNNNIRDAHLRSEKWISYLEKQYEYLLTKQQQQQQQQKENEPEYNNKIDKNINNLNTNYDTTTTCSTNFNNIDMYIPVAECYTCVIRAWNNALVYEDVIITVKRAYSWLYRQMYNTNVLIRPTTESFNIFLNLCTQGNTKTNIKHTTNNNNNNNKDNKNKPVNDIVWNHAVIAQNVLFLMIKRSQYEQELINTNQQLLQNQNQLNQNQQVPVLIVSPTTESFNYVIRGWTRCRKHIHSADRALGVLKYFESYNNPNVVPDAKTIVMIMDSISVRAKIKVNTILQLEKDIHYNVHRGNNKNKKYTNTKNTTNPSLYDSGGNDNDNDNEQIDQYQSARDDSDKNGLAEVQMLEELLNFGGLPMLTNNNRAATSGNNSSNKLPSLSSSHSIEKTTDSTTIAYNVVLICWANLAPIHSNAPYEAENLLNHMMNNTHTNNNNTVSSSTSSSLSVPRSIDTTSYYNVIYAWCKSRHNDIKVNRALFWLNKQWEDYESLTNTNTNTNTTGTSSTCNIINLRPTVRTYNTILQNVCDFGTIEQRELFVSDIFKRFDLSISSTSTPQSSNYNYKNNNNSTNFRVEDHYSDDNNNFKNLDSTSSGSTFAGSTIGNDEKLRPNSETFLFLIRSWMNAAIERGSVDGYEKGIQCLQEIWKAEDDGTNQFGCSTIDMYSLLFNASLQITATNPLLASKVLDTTMIAFNRLRRSHHTISFFHYPKVLQIGITSLSHTPDTKNERYAFISQIINDCQRDGFVSRFFFHTLWTGPLKYTHNGIRRSKNYVTTTGTTIRTDDTNKNENEMLWTIQDSQSYIKEYFPAWPIPIEQTRNIKADMHKVRQKDLYEWDANLNNYSNVVDDDDTISSSKSTFTRTQSKGRKNTKYANGSEKQMLYRPNKTQQQYAANTITTSRSTSSNGSHTVNWENKNTNG